MAVDNYNNKRIKVLHVAEAAGGVDRYLKTLFKYMDRSKIENILICSQNFNASDYVSLVDHIEQIHMTHDIAFSENLKTVKKIRKYIEQYKPDVVYGHSSMAGAFLRMADFGLYNKVLYNPHGWSFNMRTSEKKKKAYKLIERILAPYTDKIICISEAEKQTALREKICKADKLRVINNGIDLEEINSTPAMKRSDLGIPDDAFVVGTVGRLCEQKAPNIYVKAASLIKKKIPAAFFVMVGENIAGGDEAAQEAKRLIKETGLEDSFLITGWVNNPVAYEKIFDVGLLLSRWEGFGLVIPEYMACGVPVVATRVDAIPYLVKDGENGLLVDVDSPEQVADAVIRIKEETKLQDLIVHGFNTVKNRFDAQRVAQETFDLIAKENREN